MPKKKIPFLKNFILLLFLFIFSTSVNAQFERIFIEGDAVTKFAVGKEKRENIQYRENINVNVPKVSKFDNPILGLNFSINYKLNKDFSAGIGSGINVIQEERNPVFSEEYDDNILFPVFLKFRYQKIFSEKWLFLTDLNGGYQFSNHEYAYTPDGFNFKETGGFLGNIDLGIGLNLGKYTPIIKLGYEINQFKHENSLGWIDDSLDHQDKVEYSTYYNLIKFSLSLKI